MGCNHRRLDRSMFLLDQTGLASASCDHGTVVRPAIATPTCASGLRDRK